MKMLKKVQGFDPTVNAENAEQKLGRNRFETMWREHVAALKVPNGYDAACYALRKWNEKWEGSPELFLFSNDTLYAIKRESDPEWNHEDFKGLRCGYFCPWQEKSA